MRFWHFTKTNSLYIQHNDDSIVSYHNVSSLSIDALKTLIKLT